MPQDDWLALIVGQHRASGGVESLRLDDPGPGVGLIGGAEREIVLGRDVRARSGRSRCGRVSPRNVAQCVLKRVCERARVQREEVGPAPVDGGMPQIVERALLVPLCRRPVARARGPEADVRHAALDVGEIPGCRLVVGIVEHQPVGEAQGEGDHVLVLREVLVPRLARDVVRGHVAVRGRGIGTGRGPGRFVVPIDSAAQIGHVVVQGDVGERAGAAWTGPRHGARQDVPVERAGGPARHRIRIGGRDSGRRV